MSGEFEQWRREEAKRAAEACFKSDDVVLTDEQFHKWIRGIILRSGDTLQWARDFEGNYINPRVTRVTYEDPNPPEKPEVEYHDSYTTMLEGRVGTYIMVVLKNGESIGYLPITTEEEYEWLKKRLTGIRPRL